jgi:hypothetical protein
MATTANSTSRRAKPSGTRQVSYAELNLASGNGRYLRIPAGWSRRNRPFVADYDSRLTRDKRDTSSFIAALMRALLAGPRLS